MPPPEVAGSVYLPEKVYIRIAYGLYISIGHFGMQLRRHHPKNESQIKEGKTKEGMGRGEKKDIYCGQSNERISLLCFPQNCKITFSY